MRTITKHQIAALIILLASLAAIRIGAGSEAPQSTFEIQKVDEQVVLYTLYRGSYNKAGAAIGKLFALAGQKGIRPAGNAYFTYLNNPELVSSEHWLTEIRIPVNKEALKLAGTLGPGSLGEFTGVKKLPAMQTFTTIKAKGTSDAGALLSKLYAQIMENGFFPIDAHSELFLENAMSGKYAQIKTRIIIPVKKIENEQKTAK